MNAYIIGSQPRTDAVFRDLVGNLADPTLAVCTVRKPDGTLSTPAVVHDGLGLYHALIPTDQVGVWWIKWTGTGAIVAIEEAEFEVIGSVVDGAPVDTPGVGPVLGPCQVWATTEDLLAVCPLAVSATTQQLGLIDAFLVGASQLLYELSGRQFSGACRETVRPCTSSCGCFGGAANPGWHWGSWWDGMTGVTAGDGTWGWGWGFEGCGVRPCGCSPLSTVLLGYPVVAVDQVKVDGAVVDPTTYRVDDFQRLVRLDSANGLPQFWPSCQDMGVDDTQVGSFSVTYRHGVAPPPLGVLAAAQLACQFWLSVANPAACILPFGASKIVRQGITIDRGLFASWFQKTKVGKGWETGLPFVDAFLSSTNSAGLRRRPAVWSPDTDRYPRRAGT